MSEDSVINPGHEISPFRQLFNQLKKLDCSSIHHLPELVIDTDNDNDGRLDRLDWPMNMNSFEHSSTQDLTNPRDWVTLGIPSLDNDIVIIKNILTPSACKEWFSILYDVWPKQEASVLKSHLPLPMSDKNREKLRWLTFGVHHNWDTKIYDPNVRDLVPRSLDSLVTSICNITGINVKPEAGIINFYSCKSRLSPHRDTSEHNLSVPLLSLSLGSPALFVVGGQDEWTEPIVPMLLHEGDLLVMKGSRRLSYHGVPKVFCRSKSSFCDKQMVRININVRQVW